MRVEKSLSGIDVVVGCPFLNDMCNTCYPECEAAVLRGEYRPCVVRLTPVAGDGATLFPDGAESDFPPRA